MEFKIWRIFLLHALAYQPEEDWWPFNVLDRAFTNVSEYIRIVNVIIYYTYAEGARAYYNE